jgi:hypothetical protein
MWVYLDRWLAFAFGVTFAGVLLVLATVIRNPTTFQIQVYLSVLALAAGGVAAVLPGFLQIEYKGYIHAGGALAIAVIFYHYGPTIADKVGTFEEPKTPPLIVVQSFFHAMDSGDPGESWRLLSDEGRDKVGSEADWRELYKNDFVPLGHAESRFLVSKDRQVSPSGFPPGLYDFTRIKRCFLMTTVTDSKASCSELRAMVGA